MISIKNTVQERELRTLHNTRSGCSRKLHLIKFPQLHHHRRRGGESWSSTTRRRRRRQRPDPV